MLRAMLVTLVLGGWLLAASPVHAQQLVRPEKSLSASDVIRIQLEALSASSRGGELSGIEQVWAFAHPDNRRLTGPLPRFARMLRSPNYQMLLGNSGHRIERTSIDDGSAHFAVRVTSRNGGIYGLQLAPFQGHRGGCRGRLDDDLRRPRGPPRRGDLIGSVANPD